MPGLLAMRYTARLPAAAADAIPQSLNHEAAADVSSAVPGWQKPGIVRLSWPDAAASGAVSPLKPTWHGSLSSSLDKLRSLTSGTANGRTAPATQSTPAEYGSLQSRRGTTSPASRRQQCCRAAAKPAKQTELPGQDIHTKLEARQILASIRALWRPALSLCSSCSASQKHSASGGAITARWRL